jgi:Txe/YoeB family toxin of Txe-Axe toxin-antitoxin module
MVSQPLLIGPPVWDELDSFDKNLKSKCVRAFRFLSRDITHPSLQVEYVKAEGREFYRGRIDQKHRFHFERHATHYAILAISPHRLQGIG